MRLDHLLSKEHADLRLGSLGCGGAPRSRTHVSCGVAHGWNINGFDARALVGLALLVQLHLFLLFGGVGVAGTWGRVCGGGCQARCWVLRDRTGNWCGFSWWSAPGLQTAGRVGVCGRCGLVGVGVWVWWRSYVENCIVDASIFEFLWSSC